MCKLPLQNITTTRNGNNNTKTGYKLRIFQYEQQYNLEHVREMMLFWISRNPHAQSHCSVGYMYMILPKCSIIQKDNGLILG